MHFIAGKNLLQAGLGAEILILIALNLSQITAKVRTFAKFKCDNERVGMFMLYLCSENPISSASCSLFIAISCIHHFVV
jgi:hypothetical protein